MLPTFSVNINILNEKAVQRTAEIIHSLSENSYTCEWAGEAFIKAVEKEDVGYINLTSYANACNRNMKMSLASKNEASILTQEELDMGYVGVTDIVAEYVEDNIDEIINNLDMDYYVDYFLETREKLYFSKGQDIWRLMQLSKLDDKQAQKKLRIIMDEFGLRELFYYVLTKSACYNKLEVVLC